MILKRILLGVSLILILLALCFYFNHNYESHLKYPTTNTILSNYPEGSTVSVTGSVIRLNDGGFVFLDENGVTEYKIESSVPVQPTDHVQLIGILGPYYTIVANIIAVETARSYEFVILRSALALIFLSFIFLRYWKFDFKTFEFIRR